MAGSSHFQINIADRARTTANAVYLVWTTKEAPGISGDQVNIKNAEEIAKKKIKIALSAILPFFNSFLAITSAVLNNLQSDF